MRRLFRRRSNVVLLAVVLVLPLLGAALLGNAFAQTTTAPVAAVHVSPEVMQWGFLAAAFVTGISALGAAYAVAVVGGAAMGAVAEKPETAGRALVFVGLAEGIAIYGLIVALMILGYLK